jgi:serine/threonine protein kinase
MAMSAAVWEQAGLIDHKKTPFADSEVKCILQQLLRAVAHMHQHWFLHRDIKMSNLLYVLPTAPRGFRLRLR